jgi:uncharacterized oxidoreductase
MKMTDNTILITGGTSGIGLSFAQEFLRLGNKVIICGRSESRLNETKQKYPQIITKVCDISVTEQREELCKWTLQNHTDINVLINNAGIQLLTDLTQPVNLKAVREEVETNFIAPVHLTSLFAQHLATKTAAAIINISSGLAFSPIARVPVYCATKAAIHSLTLSLRYQLKNTQVKVFEIVPPTVHTELGHEWGKDQSQAHAIPVAEFIKEAMEAIEGDNLEAAIGQAKGLRAKREEMFSVMNR